MDDETREKVHHISIHAPTRGATPFPDTLFKAKEFQSTLPREERRGVLCLIMSI